MKILMDFRKFDGVVGGVEQVVSQIISRIVRQDHQIVLLSKQNRIDQTRELFDSLGNIKHIALPVDSHAISLANARLDSNRIPKIAVEEGAQLIHFTYNWSFPYKKTVPTLLTIHDVIPFTFREAMGFWRNKFIYKPAIKLACRLNTLITTISDFSRDDIAQKVGVAQDKIRVIPNGFRTPDAPDSAKQQQLIERFGLDQGYLLNVGGIHERKNIVRLIHAFARFVRETRFPGKLVITGSVSGQPYQEKMKKRCDQAVAQTQMADRVVFTGFIPDADLDQLLHRGLFLIYPSLYEGFGIPILEAMNAGIPVITSDATATREIAGDAALLADPFSIDALAQAMISLWADTSLQQSLIQKGTERATHYNWEQLANDYIRLYQQIANEKP